MTPIPRIRDILLLGLIATCISCDRLENAGTSSGQAGKAESEVLPVNVISLERTDQITETRSYTGLLKPRRSSTLSFPLSGVIQSIFVEIGDRLTVNQNIAVLNQTLLENKQMELQNRIMEQNETSDRLQDNLEQLTTDNIEARLNQLRARLNELENVVSQSEENQANPADLQARVQELEQQIDATDQQKLQQQLTKTNQEITKLTQSLQEVSAKLMQGELQAPFAGVITNRFVSEGDAVRPGTPVVQLVEDQAVTLQLSLPTQVAAGIELGRKLTVRAEGTEFTAEVVTKLPVLDPLTATQTLLLQVNPQKGTSILAGTTVSVEIERPLKQTGYQVPQSALVSEIEGLWVVYAVEADSQQNKKMRVVRRAVSVIHTSDGQAYLTGDLSDGDRIIADGLHRVVPGQAVRIAQQPVEVRNEAEVE